MNVERYFAAAKGWKPPPDSGVRVIAHLRNGAPLAVERSFGEGKVVAFLTTAAPSGTTGPDNPSFPVAMQELQAYLAREPAEHLAAGRHAAGGQAAAAAVSPQVRFVTPDEDALPAAVNALPTSDGQWRPASRPPISAASTRPARRRSRTERRSRASTPTTSTPTRATCGRARARSWPQAAAGGDATTSTRRPTFQSAFDQQAGYEIGDSRLYVLVGLLIREQLLAWSAGYHPARAGRRLAGFAGVGKLQGGGP